MAAKTWTEIADTAIDSESPGNEGLIENFYDNQECLVSIPVDCRWAQVSGSSGSLTTTRVYLPPAVNTAAANVTLEIVFEAWASDGSTQGTVDITLASGTPVSSSTVSGTTPTRFQVSISDTDVKAAAGTTGADAVLDISVTRTAGSGNLVVQNLWGASRLERAA